MKWSIRCNTFDWRISKQMLPIFDEYEWLEEGIAAAQDHPPGLQPTVPVAGGGLLTWSII